MSGSAQGLPQRLTSFLDPKTGLVTDTWWRFLNAMFQRTGGAQGTSGLDDIIQYGNMADVPTDTPPDAAAWLASAMADVADATSPDEAAWLANMMADVPDVEPFAWQAAPQMDAPTEPENDPAAIALMVAD